MFEQNSQIYPIILNKSDFPKAVLHSITIHYNQLDETLAKTYKQIDLPEKIVIKDSKKIVLKGLGDFNSEGYKTLIIYLNIK
jgi:hypothetical protein